MVKFEHEAKTLEDAFGLGDNHEAVIDTFVDLYLKHKTASKIVERIWIDETIDDNTKAFAIFSMGRVYENRKNWRGGEK